MVSCDEQPGVQVKMVVRAAHSSHPVHHSPHSPHSRPSFGSPRLVAPAPHPVPAPPRSSSPREIWRAHDWCTEYSKKKKTSRAERSAHVGKTDRTHVESTFSSPPNPQLQPPLAETTPSRASAADRGRAGRAEWIDSADSGAGLPPAHAHTHTPTHPQTPSSRACVAAAPTSLPTLSRASAARGRIGQGRREDHAGILLREPVVPRQQPEQHGEGVRPPTPASSSNPLRNFSNFSPGQGRQGGMD